jgi:predicted RNA-binding Zn-ribbon protein involved in translation (DUF1610 family)
MTSSGRRAEQLEFNVTCPKCGWDGATDGTYDPEVSDSTFRWVCPQCDTSTEEELF